MPNRSTPGCCHRECTLTLAAARLKSRKGKPRRAELLMALKSCGAPLANEDTTVSMGDELDQERQRPRQGDRSAVMSSRTVAYRTASSNLWALVGRDGNLWT